MNIQETLTDFRNRRDDLKRFLSIERLLSEITEDEKKTESMDFWDDPKEAKKLLNIIKNKKNWTDAYKEVDTSVSDFEMMVELFNEEAASEEDVEEQANTTLKSIENLEFKNMLRGESDSFDAILSINAGAGGVEAQDWAEMLSRMYLRYALANGYKADIENKLDGDGAGIKNIQIKISGKFAYGYLKGENGVHRMVRVSPFNAQGKRMTSFASVSVMPLVDDTIEIDIDESKISWDYFRCGGPGGQNVNKVESGVRLRYQYKDPYTGVEEEILIENTETRDQPKNKENARRHLKSILYEKELEHRREEQAKIKGKQKKIEWGSQIRSYVMDDRRVKDHRTNYQTGDITGVMNGKIEGFLKSYLMEFAESEN